ncbi:MAG: hypothetical protein GF355_04620, partial [Candidatus Eisenbacteria bacterium]|nr:hypothetical protein [Candidatus Eisenbacteria bacterium]
MNRSRGPTLLLLSTPILVFGYLCLRAALLSFTHDESLSYFIIAGRGSVWHSANNHLLNSLLMWIAKKLFGSGELSLRLPNLLAFPVYAGSCYVILRRGVSEPAPRLAAAAGLVVLTTNPFLLDFFALARGYGLAMTCMTAGLAIFIAATGDGGPLSGRAVFLTLVLAGLAVLAHFTLLYYYLALLLVTALLTRIRSGSDTA